MLKERQSLPVRVSPYPLRSSRSKKQKEVETPLESESLNELEDVRCVICMEPPHNAVLLQCSSFSKGCRAYLCDTTARHSNCFKQYRRNNKKHVSRCCNDNNKTLNCPLCRGEVYGTVKCTSARRVMNAKPRCCSMEKCDFSGSYSQLKTHLKSVHPGVALPKMDPYDQHMWEELEREAEYLEMLNAHQTWVTEQRLLADSLDLPYQHPMFELNFEAFIQNLFRGARSQQASTTANNMPRLESHVPVFPAWTP